MHALWTFLILIVMATKLMAGEQVATGVIQKVYSLHPNSAFVNLKVLQDKETFLIEQTCRSDYSDIEGSTAFKRGPELEFGLSIPLPQALPASSQWYMGYRCAKPHQN